MADQKGVNRFEQGVNTKVYMASLIVALLVIIVAIYFVVRASGTKNVPKANQLHPNSRLVLPATPLRLS